MSNDQPNIQQPEENANPPIMDPTFGMDSPPGAQPSAAPDGTPAANPPATTGRRNPLIQMDDRGLKIQTVAELAYWANIVFSSGMAPKSFKTPQSIALAMQKGMEHGLRPLQSLASVYVVNGMPNWTGKAALGLARASGLIVPGTYKAWIEGDGDKMVALCQSQRVGERLVTTTFSVDDAKIAKLWQKRGHRGDDTPWITYPKRMLQWKAIAHHFADNYSDLLGGMPIAEDMIEVEATVNDGAPRKSLAGTVQGPGEPDALLSGEIEQPVTVPATAPEETDKTGETDSPADSRPLSEEEIQAKAVADHEDELEKAEREAISTERPAPPKKAEPVPLEEDPTFLRIQAKAGKKK